MLNFNNWITIIRQYNRIKLKLIKNNKQKSKIPVNLHIETIYYKNMNAASTTNLFKSLLEDELIFAYTGLVSDSITHKIIELTQLNIDSKGNFFKLKNKISFLMAECYQNVARHGKYSVDVSSLSDNQGAFYVRSIADCFFIASANSVANDFIPSIKEKLEKVNSLNTDELRLLLKQVLAKGKLSDRGGAGLGIIEMARRTGRKISYDFVPIDSKTSLFFIQLTIQSPENKSIEEAESSLEHMKNLYAMMKAENLIVLHKGDFSENSVLPIIHMIEKNILRHNELRVGKQKLYNVSVEMLQNISMHAEKINKVNEGLFVLEQHNGRSSIGTCNFISKQSEQHLNKLLSKLSNLSKSELNELYRDKLRLLIDEKIVGIGIGLIYVFRKTESVDYSFSDSNENRLFSIFVEV